MTNFSLFKTYGFSLENTQKGQFEKFLSLFQEYNSHTNLSAIREADEIIEKHFVDSLFALDFLKQSNLTNILDIGSGGGFPGIPLKIMYPKCNMTLLDSVRKKVRAQEFFCGEIGLENIESIWARAEEIHRLPKYKGKYSAIVSRATAYIDKIIPWAVPFVQKGGYILLYKSPSEEEKNEIPKLLKKYNLTQKESIKYSLSEQERVILVFEKN